ncbi:MAG: hypothetical protein ACLGHP_04580, partial [Vicinamibacteria bacterium]
MAPHAPGWQEDLDSLFNLVDAQMVERRGIVAPLPAGAAAGRRAGDRPASPPPEGSPRGEAADPWFGFGLVDPADAGPAPATRDDLLAGIEQLVRRQTGDRAGADAADVVHPGLLAVQAHRLQPTPDLRH